MAYDSENGRRPIEYASKINHSAIINSPDIKGFLNSYETVNFDMGKHIMPKGNDISFGSTKEISHIFAIDGSYNETFINKRFPSIALAYFNIGVLSFEMLDYDSITTNGMIDPEMLKKIKEVSKVCFAIPTKNLIKKGAENFNDSVRISINDVFSDKCYSSLKQNELNTILEWIIFEEWSNSVSNIQIKCPNEVCDKKITFNKGDKVLKCPKCGKEVFLSDYLALYDLITEPNGASGIVAFLCNTIEQLYIVELIKFFYEKNKAALANIVFIKDGALAFFSKTFRLCEHFRKMFAYFSSANISVNLIGLEKSGTFVEHANLISEKLVKGKYYVFNEDYIRKYVEPLTTATIYGSNTYYGKKIMFKTETGDVLVAVIPVKQYVAETKISDLINVEVCLNTVSKLRCNMYDNSLVPIAIINKLVSIAALPSANILESFTKAKIKQ